VSSCPEPGTPLLSPSPYCSASLLQRFPTAGLPYCRASRPRDAVPAALFAPLTLPLSWPCVCRGEEEDVKRNLVSDPGMLSTCGERTVYLADLALHVSGLGKSWVTFEGVIYSCMTFIRIYAQKE